VSVWERIGIYLRLLGLAPALARDLWRGLDDDESPAVQRINELHRRLGHQ
jgi:hypothetical protein